MGQLPEYSISGAAGSEDVNVLRHELANVLNGLLGMAGLLRTANSGPEQEQLLEAIEDSAGQMRFLLGHAGRGGEPATESKPYRFNGPRLLERTLTAHAAVADEKGLRLLLTLSPGLPSVWFGNAHSLRQVLDNLLCNAVKFTDSGDIVLAAEPGDDGGLRLLVSDTGPGVPDGDHARIFRVGERGANSPGRPGSGLGLSLCSRIATQLGGRIDYSSRYGGGSVFTVRLPGVLDGCSEGVKPSSALENVRCELDLDRQMTCSVGGFLDRLGVEWTGTEHGSTRPFADKLLVEISRIAQRPGQRGQGVQLRPRGRALPEGVYPLRAPVLESALQNILLRLVLTWRWQQFNRGDTRD